MEILGDSQKPRVRVVKGGRGTPRSGVITVKREDGKVLYRCSCDKCDEVATLPFRPSGNRDVLCDTCMRTLRGAKPSTRVLKKRGKVVYETECDECGAPSSTPFVPKKNRPFYCKDCKRELQEVRDEADRHNADVLQQEPAIEPTPDAPEAAPSEAALVTPVEVERPVFKAPCKTCGEVLNLRFDPGPDEMTVCPKCYEAPKKPAPPPEKNKSGTRIFYNIECAKCGKKETVDFVPKFGSEAICNDCFKNVRGRRR